jgi:hypothetical protein
MPGQEWLLDMDKDYEAHKKIFDLLLEADRNIWNAVLEIQDGDAKQLEELVKPLMRARGEIHVELMRPIYKKYPALAELAGFDTADEG